MLGYLRQAEYFARHEWICVSFFVVLRVTRHAYHIVHQLLQVVLSIDKVNIFVLHRLIQTRGFISIVKDSSLFAQ